MTQTQAREAPVRAPAMHLGTPSADVVVTAILLALGHALAVPVVGNENQYLAHVIGDRSPELSSDWLVGTRDPYPFFSFVTGLVVDVGGVAALRVVAFLGTFAALLGVYLLARVLSPLPSRGVPLAAMAFVGSTLVTLSHGAFIFGGPATSAFSGLAGQYLLSKPGYLQPSLAGSLLLVALALWLTLVRPGPDPGARGRFAAALLLTLLACMLHPTYLVVTLVGLAVALVTDVATGVGWGRSRWYGTIAAAAAVLTVAANPGLIDVGSAAAGSSEALHRFAFERIPQHTLVTDWPRSNAGLVLILLLGVWLLPRIGVGRWVARWVLGALAVSAVSAAVVAVCHWSTLALLFPWRITVILVPLCATAIAVRLAIALQPLAVRHWRAGLLVVVSGLAAVGLMGTASAVSPVESDPAAAVVSAARPSGLGLIPLDAENVRLNARVRVYVDWKSPPYAGDSLIAWWARVDQVRQVEADPEVFCSERWTAGIDWVLLDAGRPAPSCTSRWTALATERGYTVLQRPAA